MSRLSSLTGSLYDRQRGTSGFNNLSYGSNQGQQPSRLVRPQPQSAAQQPVSQPQSAAPYSRSNPDPRTLMFQQQAAEASRNAGGKGANLANLPKFGPPPPRSPANQAIYDQRMSVIHQQNRERKLAQEEHARQMRAWRERRDAIIKDHNANPVPALQALIDQTLPEGQYHSNGTRVSPANNIAMQRYSVTPEQLAAAGPKPQDLPRTSFDFGAWERGQDETNPPNAFTIQNRLRRQEAHNQAIQRRESQLVPYRTGRQGEAAASNTQQQGQ